MSALYLRLIYKLIYNGSRTRTIKAFHYSLFSERAAQSVRNGLIWLYIQIHSILIWNRNVGTIAEGLSHRGSSLNPLKIILRILRDIIGYEKVETVNQNCVYNLWKFLLISKQNEWLNWLYSSSWHIIRLPTRYILSAQ